MLSGKSIDCMVYKKKDAVLNVLEPRKYRSGAPYAGVLETFADYISDGYTIVDAPASGDIDLTSKAPGKYLVCWKTNDPTGTLNVSVEKTITGTGATLHTAVVIMGIKLGSGNIISQTNLDLDISFDSGGFSSILSFYYSTINPGFGYLYETDFYNCRLDVVGAIGSELKNFYDCNFYNCIFSVDNANIEYYADDADTYIQNCLFYTDNAYSDNAYLFSIYLGAFNLYLRNCAIIGEDTTKEIVSFQSDGTTGIVSMTNIYLEGVSVYIAAPLYVYQYGVYYRNISFNSSSSASQFVAIPALSTQKFIFGVPEIDFTDTVDFADFVSLNCDISRTDQADSRLFGFGQENFYVMKFEPRYQVPDALKKGIGEGYYWFVRRKDFETDLDGKTIYNLGLYTAGGHTTAYDFASDENFLILAEDSSGNQAVLVWYSNQLYPTVYSDVWDGTDYEILNCFQIWEAESRTGIQNIFKDQTTSKGITNSPMGGQIRFNNLDREILIRI